MLHTITLTLITLALLWVGKFLYINLTLMIKHFKYIKYIYKIADSELSPREQYLVMITSTMCIFNMIVKSNVGKRKEDLKLVLYAATTIALNIKTNIRSEAIADLGRFMVDTLEDYNNGDYTSISEVHNRRLSGLVDIKAASSALDKLNIDTDFI